jgi:hypothetical protein
MVQRLEEVTTNEADERAIMEAPAVQDEVHIDVGEEVQQNTPVTVLDINGVEREFDHPVTLDDIKMAALAAGVGNFTVKAGDRELTMRDFETGGVRGRLEMVEYNMPK